MKTATTIVRILMRLTGLVLVVLGVLFWTGNARGLIPVHQLLGFVLVLCLGVMAALAARAGVQPGLVALAVVWGLVVPVLGLTQDRLLPGSAHWLIQVLHLLVGLGAIGQGENLAGRVLSRQVPAPQP